MKSITTAVATVGLVASGLAAATATASAAPTSTSTAAASAAYTPPPIEWGTCDSASMRAAGARCGLLTVPLDYAKPGGTKIRIGVSEIRHKTSAARYQGIMVVNPGGPGGSGLNLARLGAYVPNGGGDPYDWIGFDPRGVGTSRPSLACDGDYFGYDRPDYVPWTSGIETRWLQKAAGYSAACAKAGGALLDHVRTVDTVNDLESIRKAFGAKQINYYGFSYGTYLGQVYATRYPTHVRRMVWDGVVDWKDVWYDANLNQDVAFDENMSRYFAWIAEHDATYHLGTSGPAIKKLWYDYLRKARQSPFAGKIGPDEWTDAFLTAGYYVYGWEDVANAFVATTKGDYGPIVDLYDGANGAGPGSDNGYAMYLATQCTDVRWPTNWNKWERDNWGIYATHPFETWANAWYNAPCLTWAGKAAAKAPTVGSTKTPPVLLIEETYDAATPWPGAIQARTSFPSSVLIEGVNGTTHAGSLSGVACTDNRIARYLLTGRLDPRKPGRTTSDVKCPPVPAPDPAPASPSSRSASPSMADRLPADLRADLQAAAGR